MTILKCKMCGGDIIVNENQTYGTCDSCGSTMTLPKIDDERRANAFNRANHLRRQNDFDKAISAYERILNEDNTDAEAHWGIVISRYGIEYVEDPQTHERIPTCHRVQMNSILADTDYLAAVEYAPDGYTRSLYEEEAKRIFRIQKEILAISNQEDAYDVFICYKETSESGTRTKDSTIAQDVYYQLTSEGYKVFLSRITLEDKLGQQYEPYIFAALNSAKVMVVIGTKREYFEAVWVKNEWLRYLALMKKDRSKLLIPCYCDMDAYDLPEELSMLQSQDMSKIGFIQDLIRGVKKVVAAGKGNPREQTPAKPVEAFVTPSVISLYERGKIFLEDQDWKSASDYFDRVLDIDPKFAPAYIGKLCAQTQTKTEADLAKNAKPLTEYGDFTKAIRFADDSSRATLNGYNQVILDRIEYERQDAIYVLAIGYMHEAVNKGEGTSEQTKIKIEFYVQAKKLFDDVRLHKDAVEKSLECAKLIGELNVEAERLVKEEQFEHEIQKLESELIAKDQIVLENKHKKIMTIGISTLTIIIAFLIVLISVIIPSRHYFNAEELLIAEDYFGAVAEFSKAGNFKDAVERVQSVYYNMAEGYYAAGDYEHAISWYLKAGDYQGARNQAEKCLTQLRVAISAGSNHTVGLKTDGTVLAVGDNWNYQCDVSRSQDIVAISAGKNHTVCLKADGTVEAVGDNGFGQCDASSWQEIVAISAGESHTAGLKSDGTVVAVGYNDFGQCDVASWQNIVAISAGESNTVGLKANGTVVAVGYDIYGQCDVASWQDIVSISTRGWHTVGLKADGTVVAIGDNEYGQCDVDSWKDIVAISAGLNHTVGMKADGTVFAVGDDLFGGCDVSSWKDIVAISAGDYHTVGMKADGTVVAVGYKKYDQCDVVGWKLR